MQLNHIPFQFPRNKATAAKNPADQVTPRLLPGLDCPAPATPCSASSALPFSTPL